MSLVKFNDLPGGVKCVVYSEEVSLQGVIRPCLRFRFEDDDMLDLQTLSGMFTPARCKKITIVEPDESKFIYEDYTVRVKVASERENDKDQEGNYGTKEVINIVMAKKTPLELAYEDLAAAVDETQLALLEMFEAQEV